MEGATQKSGVTTLKARVLTGSAVSLGLRVVGILLSYVANILLSRSLGLHEYGQYAIALGWAAVLAVPARGGFDYSSLRYAAVYWEEGDWTALRGFVFVAASTVSTLSLLLALGTLLIPRALGVVVDPTLLLWTAVLILPTAASTLLAVMLRSIGKIFASQFYDQLLRPVILVGLILACAMAGWTTLRTGQAMVLTTAAWFVAMAGLCVHFCKAFAPIRAVRQSFSGSKDWLRLSFPLFLITGIQELLNQIQVLMLGVLADAPSAGLFAAASRLSNLISFGLSALAIVSGPLIASAFHRGDLRELGRLASLSARTALAFALVATTVLAFAGPALLRLFGEEFREAYPILMVLVAGALVNAFTGLAAYLLTLTGLQHRALAILAGALTISLALNALLIPLWGPVGAAVAATSSLIVWNLAMLVTVRRQLGVDASALGLHVRPALSY